MMKMTESPCHPPPKQKVGGSNPSGIAKNNIPETDFSESGIFSINLCYLLSGLFVDMRF